MNRTDLVRVLVNETGMPVPQATKVLDTVLDVITLAICAGDNVSLRNFGKFERRVRNPVTRANPKTGTTYDIPEKHSVGFTPSPALKRRVNSAHTSG